MLTHATHVHNETDVRACVQANGASTCTLTFAAHAMMCVCTREYEDARTYTHGWAFTHSSATLLHRIMVITTAAPTGRVPSQRVSEGEVA